MCGIWAVFGSQVNVSIQCHAAHTISHRGPDCFRIENIIHVENCCLAFHRLAIIEDNCGMQPMTLSTKPHVHLMYNGEIYNHKLLAEAHSLQVMTHLDGEPIIHLYDKLGPQAMAAHLDGVFAFCILDTIKRKVIIGRDTFGIRPLFKIHTDQGFLAICSEVKGLFGLSHSHSDHDVKIVPFPPGHVEVYDLDKSGKAWYNTTIPFNRPGQPPIYDTLAVAVTRDVHENVRTLLQAAVKKRMMSDRRIGCLLSGR